MNTTKSIRKENCKRFAVMMLAVFLVIIPLISFEAYAYGDILVFTDAPTFEQLTQNNQVYVDYVVGGQNRRCWYAVNENDVDYFAFTVTNDTKLYLAFVTQQTNAKYYYATANVSDLSTKLTSGSFNLNTNRNGYYYNADYVTYDGANAPYFVNIGEYNSVSAAIDYYISNGVQYPSNDSVYSTYDIENGYLSVIDLGQSGAEYEVTLRTEQPMLSEWLTGKFRYSNQTYWFADSWPTTETTIPYSGATLIEWERYGNRNYLGQTKNATATLTGTSSGRCMYIYNPAGQPNPSIIAVYQANMSMMENNTVHVTVEGSGLEIRVYNSQGSYSASVGGVSGSIVADDDYGHATTTTSGGAMQMTVSGGGIYTQTSGGANDVGLVQSVQNYLDGIQSTLTQFMNNIVSLLTTPIEYISSLIQQGGQFVTNIGHFWSWLPSPLPQYLITAILVVISIGIFHTFL